MARVETWFKSVLANWRADEKTVFAVDLILNELLVNVIKHGYGDDGTHEIQILLSDTGPELCIDLVDDGRAFNPLDEPALKSAANLEEASIGGRGIHLVKNYSTSHAYRREKDRNHIRLTVSKK